MSDKIPRPSVSNHDDALKWANNRMAKYSEVRSVALIIKADYKELKTEGNNLMAWSLNLKEGSITPEEDNVKEFQKSIKELIKEDAILMRTEPIIIWLPNATKKIWSIQLIHPSQTSETPC